MTDMRGRVALVTGANRGLGLAIARGLAERGLAVALSGRDRRDVEDAAGALAAGGLDVFPVILDVTDTDSVRRGVDAVLARGGGLQVLVNNAGVQLDGTKAVDRVDPALLARTLRTNLYGALAVTQASLPAMRAGDFGRIVNISSTLGTHHDMADPGSPYAEVDAPAYRLSKGALNLLTSLLARGLSGRNILVNAACPGWVRTRLGSQRAPLSPEEGADTPIWLATLPDGGPTGGIFRERRRIPW